MKTKQKCKNDERAQVRIYQIKPIQARSDTFGKISYLGNYQILEIKTFSLGSRIRDEEVGGLENHISLSWSCSSNLIGPVKAFLRLLRNFY